MPAGHLQERVRSRTHFSYQERGALASQVELPAPLFACLLDLGGALALVLRLLLVPEALLACGGAVTSVLLYDLLAPELALNLNWLAVTIVLVFPITNGISSAFQRREHAILALAEVRSLLVNIYSAHLCWDWPAGNTKGWHGRGEGPFAVEGLDGQNRAPGSGLKANGQTCLSEEHAGHIRLLLHAIIDSIQELLLVPRRGRIRHHHTSAGKEEMQQVVSAELQGRESVMRLLGRLHHATEALKAAGLPANEASRINSWTFSLTAAFERLWSYKTYRTSTTLRAVVLVFTQLLPAIYGPYYMHLVKESAGSRRQTLVFACVFACLVSSVLTVLQVSSSHACVCARTHTQHPRINTTASSQCVCVLASSACALPFCMQSQLRLWVPIATASLLLTGHATFALGRVGVHSNSSGNSRTPSATEPVTRCFSGLNFGRTCA